jgi:UDP-N-acetylenolpyruvoylglucosamine reductase
LGIPSSGCIFKNVPNTEELKKLFPKFVEADFVPGGFIIDKAGLKGLSNGDIEVSEKHAAWMINKGHGTSSQVKNLISEVKDRVADKFGVNLQEEVFFLE